jgi:hypothetical protein
MATHYRDPDDKERTGCCGVMLEDISLRDQYGSPDTADCTGELSKNSTTYRRHRARLAAEREAEAAAARAAVPETAVRRRNPCVAVNRGGLGLAPWDYA